MDKGVIWFRLEYLEVFVFFFGWNISLINIKFDVVIFVFEWREVM